MSKKKQNMNNVILGTHILTTKRAKRVAKITFGNAAKKLGHLKKPDFSLVFHDIEALDHFQSRLTELRTKMLADGMPK